MLLSLMRKHAKSWLIKVLIGIIALVFIFYFGYSFTSEQGLKMAFVNGELISGMEYQKAYRDLLEALRAQYKQAWDDSLIKALDLKRRTLEGLINQKLISQEAGRLGLDVTESEIQQAIMSHPSFQIDGQFHIGRYRALLSDNRMKPEDFEAGLAQDLLAGKLKQFLLTFMEATDQEVLDHYTHANEKIKLSLVHFEIDEFKKSVVVEAGPMEAYFQEHRQEYRIPEKIKVAYLEIDPEIFMDEVDIQEQEITDYYEYNIDTFLVPKQVKARHILFKVDQLSTEEEEKKVRDKAGVVLEEARQDKDFAALAEKYSEGPTKSKGGDLGYFSRGRMVKPFEDVAFNLKKGEISDLVRSRFGYHIIKVEDIKEERTKPLQEVKDHIVEKLRKISSEELAHEKGLSLVDQMPYDTDLGDYAAQHGLDVKYTPFFSQERSIIPGIGGDETLVQAIFSLEGNETSDLIEQRGVFYLSQVAERKASYVPEMEEVSRKLKKDFSLHLAAGEARAAAETYLATLRQGKAWAELAKESNMEPKEIDFFSRGETIRGIGREPGLEETAFGLSEEKRYPEKVFETTTGAFVIRWEGREGIDIKKYQKEKDKTRFSLMLEKNRRAFDTWLADLRANAEVEIVSPVSGE